MTLILCYGLLCVLFFFFFFFQAEDGIRDLVRSRGLGDVYKRQGQTISQPYIVAYMTEQLALKGDETVLEVGTGSGSVSYTHLTLPTIYSV